MKIYLNYGQHPFVLPNEALELMGRPRYVTFLLDQEGRKITIVPLKSHRTDMQRVSENNSFHGWNRRTGAMLG